MTATDAVQAPAEWWAGLVAYLVVCGALVVFCVWPRLTAGLHSWLTKFAARSHPPVVQVTRPPLSGEHGCTPDRGRAAGAITTLTRGGGGHAR